jgi:hypothetical protein
LELKLAEADRIDLTSFDLSMLSAEAVNDILAGASFSIASEDALLEQLLSLGDEYRPLVSRIDIRFLSPAGLALLAEHFVLSPECVCCGILDLLLHPPPPPPPSGWNSAIVPDFPTLFEDFKKKRFTLLWRGSRNGFGARDFHRRCDGHPNTLTVILDTNGNIFGGFTPVEWESRVWNGKHGKDDNLFKADPSLKSFLFTLNNPHKFPARRFALKAETKENAMNRDSDWGPTTAIKCVSNYGPHFTDFWISDNCNADTGSSTLCFGVTYTNDTGLDGKTFLTGSMFLEVKEIEVFEITK